MCFDYFVGLDVHFRTSTLCILGSDGRQVKSLTLRGGWDRVIGQLRELGGSIAICYEASIGYGALHERLTKVCRRIVVAHPGGLRLIFRSRKKNDRVDAQKLAKLLWLDEVPQVHVPASEVRSWRELIEMRRRTVQKRTRVKNGIKAILRGLGIVTAPGRSLWSKKGRAWLAALELPTTAAMLRRELLTDELDHLDGQVRRLTAELDRIAQGQPATKLLMTIPGVGPRTAEAFAAYVDDPRRFGGIRRIGSYFGLVPSQDASAGVNRLGHITKQDPASVRKLLVEASWGAIRCCPSMREYFQRLVGGRRERRKQALVAVAHKLSRIMLTMLKTGEEYRSAQSNEAHPLRPLAA